MSSQSELRNQIAALRKSKRNFPSICGLLATYSLIGIGLWALRHYPLWMVGAPVFLLIGFMQYRLVMATHEAVHKNLLVPVWLNELMGLFNASLVGVSFFNYRRAHIEHHRSPQTIQDDIDGYIYRPLLLAKPGWTRFGLLVFGVFADIFVKFKRKFLGEKVPGLPPDPEAATRSPLLNWMWQLGPLALAQGGMLILFSWYLSWWSYLVFWFLPIFLIALSLDRARTFLEHGYNYFFPGPPIPNLAEVPQSTIDVDTNFLERFLFAPFGFSWHQAHHAQLTVPFYHLPRLADLLERNQPSYHRRIKGSYLSILFRMLWADK